ncbi:MAG: amidoligase family protein, partial [Bauldia litoralis]
LHFDGEALCSAPTIAVLVDLLTRHGKALRALFETNPRCQRLGTWPRDVRRLAARQDFRALDWTAARAALAETSIIKYCDFNLLNLVEATPGKHTFEVRILPVHLDPEPILEAAGFFAALLEWSIAAGGDDRPIPTRLAQLVELLPLPEASRRHWLQRLARRG